MKRNGFQISHDSDYDNECPKRNKLQLIDSSHDNHLELTQDVTRVYLADNNDLSRPQLLDSIEKKGQTKHTKNQRGPISNINTHTTHHHSQINM